MAGSDLVHFCKCSPLSDLLFLEGELDETLLHICKASASDGQKATAAAEKRMTQLINKAWKSTANDALSASAIAKVAKNPSKKKIDAFVKYLGISLSTPLTKKQITAVKKQIDRIWKTSKRIAAKQLKVRATFTKFDTGAVAAINRQQVFWIGDFYSTHLSDRIRAVSDDVLLQSGFSGAEAGKELARVMDREFGITVGGKTKYAPHVPARYSGKKGTDYYFRQVASTAAHQARTFSRIEQFRNAGVKRYQLVNPSDERTGQICQLMNGKIFSIETGVDQMNAILSAKDPADVKQVAPWLSATAIESALLSNPKQTEEEILANAGVTLPPFHSLCRTYPLSVR